MRAKKKFLGRGFGTDALLEPSSPFGIAKIWGDRGGKEEGEGKEMVRGRGRGREGREGEGLYRWKGVIL